MPAPVRAARVHTTMMAIRPPTSPTTVIGGFSLGINTVRDKTQTRRSPYVKQEAWRRQRVLTAAPHPQGGGGQPASEPAMHSPQHPPPPLTPRARASPGRQPHHALPPLPAVLDRLWARSRKKWHPDQKEANGLSQSGGHAPPDSKMTPRADPGMLQHGRRLAGSRNTCLGPVW